METLKLGSKKKKDPINIAIKKWGILNNVDMPVFVSFIKTLEGYLGKKLEPGFEDIEWLKLAKYLTLNHGDEKEK